MRVIYLMCQPVCLSVTSNSSCAIRFFIKLLYLSSLQCIVPSFLILIFHVAVDCNVPRMYRVETVRPVKSWTDVRVVRLSEPPAGQIWHRNCANRRVSLRWHIDTSADPGQQRTDETIKLWPGSHWLVPTWGLGQNWTPRSFLSRPHESNAPFTDLCWPALMQVTALPRYFHLLQNVGVTNSWNNMPQLQWAQTDFIKFSFRFLGLTLVS